MSLQPGVATATAPDGFVFQDLNGNGILDPYEDPRLSPAERTDDLVRRLSLREKAGLMFQTMTSAPPTGELVDEVPRAGRCALTELVTEKFVNHFNVHSLPEPRLTARWVNELQALARRTSPHGIPITISTDPRHSFAENWGASFTAEHFSAWPEPLGMAALGDEDTVREFARIARAEYTAVGIRSALHPTIDLATEPRWARQYSTFGQDAELVTRLALAYIDGFEGSALGRDSVATMAKHFPGGGPQLDGEDAHFPYGREQVYPGEMFEYHLRPFRSVVERGVSAIMPYYGMPVGLELDGKLVEQVGFGFNKRIVTGLLREELGYDGVICTDWGLVTESVLHGRRLPARAWGVEHLGVDQRVQKIIDAGCDQLGGEECPEVLVALVENGLIGERRLDESVRRLLMVKFELGLFDNPFVDEGAAAGSTRLPTYVAAGERAQSRSATILKNAAIVKNAGKQTLPLALGTAVFSADIPDSVLSAAGLNPMNSPGDADVTIVRVDAPYEPRDEYMLETSFHAGSLEYGQDTVDHLIDLARSAPVILVVHLDRPAILTPLEPHCAVMIGVYGSSDAALLAALTGVVPPEGRLPFQLPSSQDAVVSSRPDVPGDTSDPLYENGFRVEI